MTHVESAADLLIRKISSRYSSNIMIENENEKEKEEDGEDGDERKLSKV